MKKSLLLITLLVISVSAFAAAPNFPDLPDVKLIIGTGLTPAFDIECFNTGDASTTWAQGGINFAGLSSVSSRWAIQGGFGSATVGSNSYTATNEGGTGTGTNKVKWSTYRIKKLPIVGLNVGDSVTVNVGNYVSPSIPPSFGTANALVISDTTKVTAAWNGASQVSITLIAAATGPVYVDVIASPTATPTIGYDQDKERISVYTNLLTNGGSFSTSADTGKWGAEVAKVPASGTIMSIGWAASVNDAAGTPASGVMTLTGADSNQTYKGTNLQSTVPFTAGQWYTARLRYSASGAGVGGSQAQAWIFSNIVDGVKHIDLATNIMFKASSTWTWLNIPVYSNQSGTGYAQLQFKPSAALVVNVDEVQIINAAPSLISATRGCDKYGYAYGDFDTAADTSGGWAIEGYNANVPTKPGISIAGGVATFSFTGGTLGTKWTASSGPGVVVTPAVSEVGKDVGIKYSVTQQSGGFTNYAGVVAQWVYGVPTNGGLDFFTGGQLIGAAEFGGITNGTHQTVGPSNLPYYQFQFGIKGDQSASIVIDNVDFISDNDDPNFGDQILFP